MEELLQSLHGLGSLDRALAVDLLWELPGDLLVKMDIATMAFGLNFIPNLGSIVDRIRPSVEELLDTELRHDPDALVARAVRANVRSSVHQLRHGSEIIERLIDTEGLLVVGAEYSLESGRVDFFAGLPDRD